MQPVTEFKGEYAWASNFWECDINWKGELVGSSEHAFHVEKTLDPSQRAWVRSASSPGEAKRRGRQVTIRPDWDACKRDVMFQVNRAKYRQHGSLLAKLLATEDAVMWEGNSWNDRTWGAVLLSTQVYSLSQARRAELSESAYPLWRAGDQVWEGHNWLGRILMMIRELHA